MSRLAEIQQEMLELLDEAKSIVRNKCSQFKQDRMMAYWYAHIKCGLTDEHEFIGGDGATMQECVDDLENEGDCVNCGFDFEKTDDWEFDDCCCQHCYNQSNGDRCGPECSDCNP